MKLIVGLGNPGEQYEHTRHNLGFMVLDHFLKDFSTVKETAWDKNEKLKSDLALIDWQPKVGKAERVILAKPNTFMNNSGMSVQLIADFYKIAAEDIWIVNDDLDLPLGKLKIRFGGAAAGHHGVEDILEKLGTDKFWRFRLGIGEIKTSASKMDDDGNATVISKRNMGNTNDFVLGVFTSSDMGEVKKLIKNASNSLEVALEKGLESAMNRFNTN
jgi:PTH1 family peptidyl-tRNA hydrolase